MLFNHAISQEIIHLLGILSIPAFIYEVVLRQKKYIFHLISPLNNLSNFLVRRIRSQFFLLEFFSKIIISFIDATEGDLVFIGFASNALDGIGVVELKASDFDTFIFNYK